MAAQDSHRPADDLEALAQARFGALSQPELKLLRAACVASECGPSVEGPHSKTTRRQFVGSVCSLYASARGPKCVRMAHTCHLPYIPKNLVTR